MSVSLAVVVSVGLSWVVQCDGIELAIFTPGEKTNAQDFANGFNLALGWKARPLSGGTGER